MVKGLKKVAKGLKKASKTHAKQAKIVDKHIKKMKKFPSAAKDPNSRLRQARRRWKC